MSWLSKVVPPASEASSVEVFQECASVGADYVLVMQTGEEQVAAFVGEHQRRLRV